MAHSHASCPFWQDLSLAIGGGGIYTDGMDTTPTPMRVVVSLDVEEEGLFSGRYASSGCGVRNVALLERLAPLSRDLGFPLTLFCAHTVLTDVTACRTLERLRDDYGAEIAAHLHHWNTPPACGAVSGTPPRTHTLDRDLLRRRLASLLDAGRVFNGAPLTSFRMGRWDLKNVVRPLLAEQGITLDSSVCPLRQHADGPDHFLAPADPYWVDGATPEGTPLLEAPITQVPLLRFLPALWRALVRDIPRRDTFHFWGALSANPFWHGACVMRAAARLHQARGGRVLSLFWHSSELMPGGSPQTPDQRAADAHYEKIFSFFRWLRDTLPVRGVTAARLRAEAPRMAFPHRPAGQGDW